MRVGVVLPSFRFDPDTALDAARRADGAGLDGVFVYDHLFPMGRPDRPAISCFPLLGAIAASTTSVTLGPLVARVGLVPDAMLVNQLQTLPPPPPRPGVAAPRSPASPPAGSSAPSAPVTARASLSTTSIAWPSSRWPSGWRCCGTAAAG